MSRSSARSGTSKRSSRDRCVNVEIDASKSDIEAWKWDIEAFISRSTRQCRDRCLEVRHRRFEVVHRSVHLEIDASMSRSTPRSPTSTLRSGTSRLRSQDRGLDLMMEQFQILPPDRHSGDVNMSGCECKRARSVSAIARNIKRSAPPERNGTEIALKIDALYPKMSKCWHKSLQLTDNA